LDEVALLKITYPLGEQLTEKTSHVTIWICFSEIHLQSTRVAA
jgi:hypothetical protein